MAGSATLIGGEPGIGKSTLLIQACAAVARTGGRVVYVSGGNRPPRSACAPPGSGSRTLRSSLRRKRSSRT